MTDVVVVIGAGGIARRQGFGKTLLLADRHEEIAIAASFLLGSDASFITGSDFLVGGETTAVHWFGNQD